MTPGDADKEPNSATKDSTVAGFDRVSAKLPLKDAHQPTADGAVASPGATMLAALGGECSGWQGVL
jgi:hypothetical protein